MTAPDNEPKRSGESDAAAHPPDVADAGREAAPTDVEPGAAPPERTADPRPDNAAETGAAETWSDASASRETPESNAGGVPPQPPVAPGIVERSRDWSIPAVVAAFIAGVALVLAGYVALNHGKLRASDQARSYAPTTMQIARGSGQIDRGVLVARAPGTDPLIVSVITDFRAQDLATIAWDVSGVPANADVRLLFSSDTLRRVHNRPLAVEDGRVLPIALAGDRNWLGRITGLAIAVQAPGATVQIRGVTAKPQSAGQLLTDRLAEWFAFEGWTGTSINSITGGAASQSLPLPVPIVLGAALAVAMLAAVRRLRPAAIRQSLALVVACVFIAAWAVVDARWTVHLARQVAATWERYQGLADDARRAAAEDGELAAFIDKVKAALPPEPTRVLVLSQAHYFRGRAGWHLLPHRALWEPVSDAAPPPGRLAAGDHVVIWQRPGIQYDAATQRLRFDNGVELGARLVVSDRGAALFAIL